MVEGIKERFAIVRKHYGLNVKEFAASLDMEPTTASSIESGKREPSKEVLYNLAIRYAISLNWIFTGFGEMLLSKAVAPIPEKHPLIVDMETLIKQNMEGFESRLNTLESSLKRLENPVPEVEYPVDGGEGGYTAESQPKYGESAGPVAFREQIAAGPPIHQSDDGGLVVDVPLRYIKTDLSDYYTLRIRGNSMIDAFIPDGSMVLIRKSDTPVDRAIQVVSIDGQATLKRLREKEDRSWTVCYEDGSGRTVAMGEGLRIQGDFVAVLPPSTRPRMRGGE
jgi:SOS-response transcriptional repressor LexA/DNA-binding XRE family transcriptional regulator